jgi:hypothetical protein
MDVLDVPTSPYVGPTNSNPKLVGTSNTIDDTNFCPFEGPEKLLEIWFEPDDPESSQGADADLTDRVGLRTVDRAIWEDMLDIVKCKVLSVVYGKGMDAYLLRYVHIPKIPPGINPRPDGSRHQSRS